jgi:hypothetical protein
MLLLRPGTIEFLARLSDFCEVVLFTAGVQQ